MRTLPTIHGDADTDAGAPGVTLRLAEAYRARGHRSEVLSFSDLPARWPLQAKMLAFPQLVARRAGRGGLDVLDASTGDAWTHATLARRRGRPPRPPLVVTRSHGLEHSLDLEVRAAARQSGPPLSWKYPLYNGGPRLWEVARSMRLADLTLLLNQADRDLAVGRLGVPAERAVVVRNGVPQRFLGREMPSPPALAGPLRIAVVGAYIERKGVRVAASALSRLLLAHPDWAVSFLGTGAPSEEVYADYPAAVHHQIRVVARYPNVELPGLLDGHQVHLFATLSEGGPLALLETMACGLAPVVTRVPGPTEVVTDRENGWLVPPRDPVAIELALEALDRDRELLATLAARAHRTVQTYGWQAIADEQLAMFEQRIGDYQSSR